MNCLIINYWVWRYTQKNKVTLKRKKKTKMFFFQTDWIWSVLPICSWVWHHPLKHGQATRSHAHEGNWVSIPWQPSTTKNTSVRGGTSWIPPSSLLGFLLAPTCTSLLQAARAAESLWMQQPLLCPENTVLWQLSPVFGSCNFSAPSFVMSLNTGGKKVNTDVPFRTQYCTVIYFLHSDQLWLSSPFLTSF